MELIYTDWDTIERLEEVDPSYDDGSWGGDYCRHGRYVGTPGGADFMCGDCEMGYNTWHDDPRYGLAWGLGASPSQHAGLRHAFYWRASTLVEAEAEVLAQILKIAQSWQAMYDEVEAKQGSTEGMPVLHWAVHRLDGGYWDER